MTGVKDETYTGRDYPQAASGRSAFRSGQADSRCLLRFVHIGVDVLQVAQVVCGMSVSQGTRLRRLEVENTRLRRAVADLTLDKQILRESQERNLQALSGSVAVC